LHAHDAVDNDGADVVADATLDERLDGVERRGVPQYVGPIDIAGLSQMAKSRPPE
jgi:hypothetical protein